MIPCRLHAGKLAAVSTTLTLKQSCSLSRCPVPARAVTLAQPCPQSLHQLAYQSCTHSWQLNDCAISWHGKNLCQSLPRHNERQKTPSRCYSAVAVQPDPALAQQNVNLEAEGQVKPVSRTNTVAHSFLSLQQHSSSRTLSTLDLIGPETTC